jgi:ribosome-associated heat shock protein Hsp15
MAANAGASAKVGAAEHASQRLDKWLWIARFAKSRTLAQELIVGGKVRVNKVRVIKPSFEVKPTDVLTMSLGPRQRIIEVRAFRDRRGSATDAQPLYVDLAPLPVKSEVGEGQLKDTRIAARVPGSGRPTKRDRRQLDRFKSQSEDP